MHEKREYRTFEMKELRAEKKENGTGRLVGYAAVFNSLSEDIFDFSKLGPAGNDELYQAPLTVIPGGKTPEQICAEIQDSLGDYTSGQ